MLPSLLTALASSFMNTSPFQTKFHHFVIPAIISFVSFTVSIIAYIPQQPVLLPPSFTAEWIMYRLQHCLECIMQVYRA